MVHKEKQVGTGQGSSVISLLAVFAIALFAANRFSPSRDSFAVGSLAAAEEAYFEAKGQSKEGLESVQIAAAKLATAKTDPKALGVMLDECIGELDSLQSVHDIQVQRKETLSDRIREALAKAAASISQMTVSPHRTTEEKKMMEEEIRYRQLLREAEQELGRMASILEDANDLRLLAESNRQLTIAKESNDGLQDLAKEVARKAGYFQQKASDFLAAWN